MKNKIFAILMSFLTCIGLASCKPTTHDMSEYILEMDYKENFKVLQLTDLHMSAKDDRERQYKFLDKTYDLAENVDLVVVTGDLFTFADKRTAKELFAYFDSKKVNWTVTFGNHDEQCYFSMDWLTTYLNKLTKSGKSYCKFVDVKNDNVTGYANFAINLIDRNTNTLKQQVIVLDSNRYHFGVEGSTYMYYDYIHEDQVKWYGDLVDYTKAKYGEYDSMMFYHIEIPEFANLFTFDEETKVATPNSGVEVLFGTQREKVCCPEYNSGLYEVIKAKGSTKAMFVGHDHTNDYVAKYEGIYYCLGVTSTDRIYYEDGVLGGLTCKIASDGSYSFAQVLHEYED